MVDRDNDNGILFRSVRVCLNGRWATDEEVADMLAKGAKWAARRRDEGILPPRPN